jgi:glucosamine--fructose-6-phosphate aminotransferase (isomerizing)
MSLSFLKTAMLLKSPSKATRYMMAKIPLVTRDVTEIDIAVNAVTKGEYSHFMEKEIYEQPDAVANTINGKLGEDDVLDNIFGLGSSEIFTKIKRIQFVACGTSLHAGKVGRFWFEQIAKIPCYVDFASEYRYRDPLVEEGTLFVTISQSGETADTLACTEICSRKRLFEHPFNL